MGLDIEVRLTGNSKVNEFGDLVSEVTALTDMHNCYELSFILDRYKNDNNIAIVTVEQLKNEIRDELIKKIKSGRANEFELQALDRVIDKLINNYKLDEEEYIDIHQW